MLWILPIVALELFVIILLLIRILNEIEELEHHRKHQD